MRAAPRAARQVSGSVACAQSRCVRACAENAQHEKRPRECPASSCKQRSGRRRDAQRVLALHCGRARTQARLCGTTAGVRCVESESVSQHGRHVFVSRGKPPCWDGRCHLTCAKQRNTKGAAGSHPSRAQPVSQPVRHAASQPVTAVSAADFLRVPCARPHPPTHRPLRARTQPLAPALRHNRAPLWTRPACRAPCQHACAPPPPRPYPAHTHTRTLAQARTHSPDF